MKPSELFADLKADAEGMDDCKDRADLLALFVLADQLHDKVEGFGHAVGAVKGMLARSDKHFRELLDWRIARRGMIERVTEEPLKVIEIDRR